MKQQMLRICQEWDFAAVEISQYHVVYMLEFADMNYHSIRVG